MRFLKQNTAQRVTVGPFLDATDGVTPETALTVTGCHLTLMVDSSDVPTLALDANATASGGNNDMVHVTNDDAGFYDLELTAAQTNYVGRAILAIIGTAHLPVFHEFTILPAQVYDSLVLGSDKLDVNAAEHGGTTQTGRDIGASVLLSSGTGTGQISLSSGAVTAGTVSDKTGYRLTATTGLGNQTANITGTVSTVTNLTNLPSIPANWITAAGINTGAITNAKFAAGAIDAAAIADNALDAATFAADFYTRIGLVAYGTAQSATSTTLVLASSSAFANDELNGAVVLITGGTGAGQSRVITDYVGSTDTATVDAWTTTPSGTITYVVFAAAPASATALPAVNVTQVAGTSQTAGDLAALVTTIDGIVDTIVARVVGTLAAGTHSPQSGDAYARLGAPAGASVIADLGTATAATQAIILDVKAKTDNLPAAPAATGDIPAASSIADAVWDEALAGHATAGSAGAALSTASTGGVDAAALADAVFDEALSGHTTAGTAGAKLNDLVNTDTSGLATAAALADVPTVAEFEARTLPAADYVVTSDTIAGATTVGSVTNGVTLATAAVDAILDEQIGDGTITMRQALRGLIAAVAAGKLSGAATTMVTIRNVADTQDVIVATVDADGNRSAITFTP